MSSKTVKLLMPEIDTLHFRIQLILIPFANQKLHVLLVDSSINMTQNEGSKFDPKLVIYSIGTSSSGPNLCPIRSTSGKALRSDAS